MKTPTSDKDFLRLFILNKNNPSTALYQAFSLLRQEILESLDEKVQKLLKGKIPDMALILEQIKGKDAPTLVKGVDYFDGKDADEEKIVDRLSKLLLPHITSYIESIKPKDGKTPTHDQLVAIIRPLMPEKAEEVDYEYILSEVCKEIPKYVDKIDVEAMKASILASLPPVESLSGEIIVERVNELPIEPTKQIGKEHIRGLEDELKIIRQNIREVKKEKGGGGGATGGGMGNVVSQTFNLTSATTTITLSNKIAANGNALWAYYNSAFLVPGTGYTVGADRKTVTLLFTPENGTFIDVTYVRS